MIHGTSGMSRMDGYSVDTNFPALRSPRTLYWMPDGVWALDVGGLQRLRGQIGNSTRWTSSRGLDRCRSPRPGSERSAGGRLLIVVTDWLAVYEPATRRSTRVLEAAQTGLGAFGDAAASPNGRILVSGGRAA